MYPNGGPVKLTITSIAATRCFAVAPVAIAGDLLFTPLQSRALSGQDPGFGYGGPGAGRTRIVPFAVFFP